MTALLLEAIRNGQPTSDREIRLALGMTVLPPGVDASPLSVAIEHYRGRFGDAPWSIGTPTNQQAGRPAAIRRVIWRRKALAAEHATHDPWPAENYEVLNWAVRVYSARFGKGLSVQQFLRWPVALAREILVTVQRDEKLTGEDLHHRLGMTPPPVDGKT